MALQPSGTSKEEEIIFIETEEIYFSINGSNDSYEILNEATLKVTSKENLIISKFDEHTCFKEYKNYEIIIEGKNNCKIEFYHENYTIRNKITQKGKSRKILSGIINFKGDIGYSDLYVLVNGKEHIKITLEVFPSKIDYKNDYKALLEDINKEIYNLSYSLLARTYLGGEIKDNKNTSSEFYSILKDIFEKLLKAIDVILCNPNHNLVKENRIYKHGELKGSSIETIRWLEKRPYVIKNVDGKYIPTEALQVKKTITYDTNENRFLKFMLLSVIDKIDKFVENYSKFSWNFDNEVIDKLSSIKKEISKRINTTFLRNIDEKYNESSISLVFTMASGYKEVYKYYLILKKGLNIKSDIFSISMKELPLLYEYWCFIKLNSILRKKYKLISCDFIKINNDGIVISLKKGIKSTLMYKNPKSGETFKMTYNSKISSETVNQKPDNILSTNKDGKEFQIIFDAKYKIDYRKDYIKKYGGIGPKEEDINTMHRYRDAIVSKNTYEKCVLGAFVLFPFSDEESYKNHNFYKSIKKVNIGALPFLPLSTNLVDEFLDLLNLFNKF